MKALNPTNLMLAAIVGIIIGMSTSAVSVSLGWPLLTSPPSLILAMLGLGIISLTLTVPLVQYRRKLERYRTGSLKQRPERVNPFYAYRVLVWARASALAGAAFLGWHVGQLIWLASFAVPAASVVQNNGLGASASAALVVLAWLAERNCRAGQDSDGENEATG
jgi:hypothetical protein